jgi:hypothetical protein
MAAKRKVKTFVYKFYTYDLIADGEGGRSVNDVYPQGEIEVRSRFSHPTDRQLSRAVGGRGLSWDGENEGTLYANSRNGNPACELRYVRVEGETAADVGPAISSQRFAEGGPYEYEV